jgi:hypothetical protein
LYSISIYNHCMNCNTRTVIAPLRIFTKWISFSLGTFGFDKENVVCFDPCYWDAIHWFRTECNLREAMLASFSRENREGKDSSIMYWTSRLVAMGSLKSRNLSDSIPEGYIIYERLKCSI